MRRTLCLSVSLCVWLTVLVLCTCGGWVVALDPAAPTLLTPNAVLPSGRSVRQNAEHNRELCRKFLADPFESVKVYDLFTHGFSEAGQDRFVSDLFGRKPSGTGRTVWRHRQQVDRLPPGATLDRHGRWARPFAGFYVEVGSHDGETHSNTWLFEHCLQWTGILVEPNLFAHQTSRKWRPNSIHYSTAISKENRGSCNLAKVGRTLCTDLQSLLDQHQVDVVDFLSVDTGGSELDVLLSVDFEKTAVNVVCVSDTERKAAIEDHLRANGFRPVGRVGKDTIFVHEDFSPVRIPTQNTVGGSPPSPLSAP